jgi:hypothetical protein
LSLPDDVRHALFWVAAGSFALAQAGLLIATLRRAPRDDETGVRGRFGRGAEVAMVLLPAVGLTLLLLLSWAAVRVSSP